MVKIKPLYKENFHLRNLNNEYILRTKASDGDTKPLNLRSKLSDVRTKPLVNVTIALIISQVNFRQYLLL